MLQEQKKKRSVTREELKKQRRGRENETKNSPVMNPSVSIHNDNQNIQRETLRTAGEKVNSKYHQEDVKIQLRNLNEDRR